MDEFFKKHGIDPDMASKHEMFLRFEGPEDLEAMKAFDPVTAKDEAAVQQWEDRAARAPGLLMRRWPVPGAPPVTAELRPDWAIWSGEAPKVHDHDKAFKTEAERAQHVNAHTKVVNGERLVRKGATTGRDVLQGLTDEEYMFFLKRYGVLGIPEQTTVYRRNAEGTWEKQERWVLPSFGADHAGVDVRGRHAHMPIAKYLFRGGPLQDDSEGEHDHLDFFVKPTDRREMYVGERRRLYTKTMTERKAARAGDRAYGERLMHQDRARTSHLLSHEPGQGHTEFVVRASSRVEAFGIQGPAVFSNRPYPLRRPPDFQYELKGPVTEAVIAFVDCNPKYPHPTVRDAAEVAFEPMDGGMWRVSWTAEPGGLEGLETHEHSAQHKDPSLAYARRLSLSPASLERLDAAERVWFIMEGSLKSAAVESRGECVVAVPSITLWEAKELREFATRYLAGKRVLVTCDSDWNRTRDDGYVHPDAVVRQALLLRDYLRDCGAEALAVAPTPRADEKRGIDDFVADGEDLDDVVVIDREGTPLLPWLEERGIRALSPEADAAVAEWLSVFASEDGLSGASAVKMGSNLKVNAKPGNEDNARRVRVADVLRRLENYGVVWGEDADGKRVPVKEVTKARIGFHRRKQFKIWPSVSVKVNPSYLAPTKTPTLREYEGG